VSGFAGVVSLDGAPPDTRLLERIAETLAFRGPDGTHITTKPGAGFCFTFLRTGPAPQCPSQPCSLDGRVWLLGDVRLDGRDDLRRKLEQHGDEIGEDVTDEELLLRAWHRWREDTLAELIGDYSFALWDAEAKHLCCVRDLTGARPFFYGRVRNHLYFTNTLNALRCTPEISSALDNHFIGDFLLQGWCSYPERTAFQGISRLPAGHTLLFSRNQCDVRRFSSVPIEAPLYLKREEEYVEQFRSLLEQAVLDRLPRGPAAIFMSGGLDSTSLAAVAVQCARKRALPLDLRAFTIDHQPLFDDQEGVLASVAARHLGISIEVQSGAIDFPYADWHSSPPPLPEPFHEPFQSQYVKHNQRVAQYAAVAFYGYGGDGVLTGQTWPFLKDLVWGLKFGMIARTFGKYVLTQGRIPPLRAGLRAKFRRLIKPSDPMAAYPPWLASGFAQKMCLRDRWQELQRPNEGPHPWHPKAFGTLNSSYWPAVLEGDDAGRSGAAVEGRSPFLDLRVQRFLLRVPPVPLGINKELIRRMVSGLLPEEIRSRPKTPFAGDQVALQVRAHGWSPLPVRVPPRALHEFVDWERFRAELETSTVTFPWPNLRPISLVHWLHCIENGQPIQ